MSEIIEKVLRKSNVNASTDFDFYQIKRKSDYLLDCVVSKTLDDVTYQFDIEEVESFTNIRESSLTFKYQALLNVRKMYQDMQRLKISLNPNNLYFDTNMMPKAMLRDVYMDIRFNEAGFVEQYKSLIGYTLQTKYTFEDFNQGGNKLLSKNKNTLAYVEAKTIDEIVEILNKEYQEILAKLQYSVIEVDKKKYKTVQISNRISIMLLVICIIAGMYSGIFLLQEQKQFNKANEEYIKQDYIAVMETLENIGINRMNQNTKYILAISNIKTESLSDEQTNNILSSITLNTDDRILNYWIYLGKSDVEEAIDVAKQLGNKEYLAYGYMKQKLIVENDKKLSGSEREEKLKEIENNLSSIDISSDTEKANSEQESTD